MKANVINYLLLYISQRGSILLLIDSDSLIISPVKEYSSPEVADGAKYLIELGYLKGMWQKAKDGDGYTCWVNGLTELGQEYVKKYLQEIERIRQQNQKIKKLNQKILEENQTIIKKTKQILDEAALIVAESKKLRCCAMNFQRKNKNYQA